MGDRQYYECQNWHPEEVYVDDNQYFEYPRCHIHDVATKRCKVCRRRSAHEEDVRQFKEEMKRLTKLTQSMVDTTEQVKLTKSLTGGK